MSRVSFSRFVMLFALIFSVLECMSNEPTVHFAAPFPDLTKEYLGYPLLQNTEVVTLYMAEPETGTYSHHCHLAVFNGAIYAAWSSHKQDEDAPGQRVLMRRTLDHGVTWEEAVELFPPLDDVATADKDGSGRRTQCSNGFVVYDNTLYAFSEVWDDGGWWRQSGQGQLVRPIYADGSLGQLFWLRYDAPAAKDGLPVYPAGSPELVEKLEDLLLLPGNELTWEFRHNSSRPIAADGHSLCEPSSAWPLGNRVWAKLYRDLGKEKPLSDSKTFKNYVSYSFNNGKTWTSAVQTDFPDAGSRSSAGTLPDGQAYVVSNLATNGNRGTLTIALSADRQIFDRVYTICGNPPVRRYPGRWKGSGYQYPDSLVQGDSLWVLCSVNKEDIQVVKIPLSELSLGVPLIAAKNVVGEKRVVEELQAVVSESVFAQPEAAGRAQVVYREIFPNSARSNISLDSAGWRAIAGPQGLLTDKVSISGNFAWPGKLEAVGSNPAEDEVKRGFLIDNISRRDPHLLYTEEFSLSLKNYQLSKISWYQNQNDGGSDLVHIAICIDGVWYASKEGFLAAHGKWEKQELPVSDSRWVRVDYKAGEILAMGPPAVPNGSRLEAIGFFLPVVADSVRLDEMEVLAKQQEPL
ncbi:MAG: exo-alpha-sialidase [Kiritimatiellales bacterium]